MIAHTQPLRDVSNCTVDVTRECQVCHAVRPLVLFPKTLKTGAYSKVCQLCATVDEKADEAFLREDCFWRNRKLVPLREKRGRG